MEEEGSHSMQYLNWSRDHVLSTLPTLSKGQHFVELGDDSIVSIVHFHEIVEKVLDLSILPF